MKTIVRLKCNLLFALLGLSVISVAQAVPKITNAEYFFDLDPGVGKGVSLNTGSPGDSINQNYSFSLAGLTIGQHKLFLRFQDSAGVWGLSDTRAINIIAPPDTASQRIAGAEYFLDTDPGTGGGSGLATGGVVDSITGNYSISLAGKPVGGHKLYIRLRSLYNIWGGYEVRSFNVVPPPDTSTLKISGAEYYFDNDPGLGSGQVLNTGSQADSVNLLKSISIASLSKGSHSFNLRFKSNNGLWGNSEARSFKIDNLTQVTIPKLYSGEYFIDNDPGVGLATTFSTGITDSFNVQVPVVISGLSIGSHSLSVRVRDSIGLWSSKETRYFNIYKPETNSPLTSVEFFYDTDPGVGKAFQISSFPPADSINRSSPVLVNGLDTGNHYAYVRVRDTMGVYSLYDVKKFHVCNVLPIADFKTDYISFDTTVNFTNLSTSYDGNTQFYWDINGDGTNDYNFETITHKYSSVGIYNVRLIATNGGVCADTIIRKVYAGADTCLITSKFDYLVNPNLKVSFTNKSTGNIGQYYWNFGDGTTSAIMNVTHTYDKPGYYLVSLAVKNTSNECTDYSSVLILAGESSCHASFTYHVNDTTKEVTLTDLSGGSNLRYFWYFGDGSYSTEQNPIHQYVDNGAYDVSLTISNPDANCSDKSETFVQVGEVKCNASFTTFVDSTTNTVYFTDHIAGHSSNLLWNFGDGKISVEHNPIHTFAHAGYFTVGLNTFNIDGWCMDYKEQVVLVGTEGIDCDADFIYQSDTSNTTVSFFDNSKGDILGYIWNFGDGTGPLPEKNPQHTYNTGGNFNVCLTVVNSNGISNIKCKPVLAGNNPKRSCRADFNYSLDSVSSRVYFTDVSSGNPNNWNWDLGNGVTSTTQNGDVVYIGSGYYLVSLKIRNSETGCQSKTYKLLNIGKYDDVKAGFGFDPQNYNKKAGGYPVDFIGAGSGDQSRLQWSFGDGSPDDTTTNTPTHNYDTTGTYNVCYTVTDQVLNQSDTYCQNITTTSLCDNDTAKPVAACKSIVVKLDEFDKAIITPEMLDNGSGDRCGSITLSVDKTLFDAGNIGYNTVKFTVKDASNNISTCTALVKIESTTDVRSLAGNQKLKIWPNPVSGSVNISYALEKNSLVTATLYDLQGKKVETLVSSYKTAGNYNILWNSALLNRGSYLLEVKSSDGIIGRSILVKK
jgi:PKD repeat protein